MISLQRFEETPALTIVDIDDLLTKPDALHARVRASLAADRAVLRPLPPGIRRAAVLLLLVHAGGEAALLLTKRSQSVVRHKGQVSLPGGVVESDESPLDAALREASEEIGVRAEDVTILGMLHDEKTVVSGFMLTPFVGTIAYPYPLRASPAEVHSVLEAPLRSLLDPRNVRAEIWTDGPAPRTMYVYTVAGDVVWGATARVIMQFLRKVFGEAVPDGTEPGGTRGGRARA
jgi:8-oxo-dGTP pyrophosphatase MutT (NUDIX family)